jgi:hypothetical protein
MHRRLSSAVEVAAEDRVLRLSKGGGQARHRRRMGTATGPSGERWYDKAMRCRRSRGSQVSRPEEAGLQRTRDRERVGARSKGM